MTNYKVHVLKVAELSVPITTVCMDGDCNNWITAPIFIWYLEGGTKKILMDAGMKAPDSTGNAYGLPASGGGEEGVRKALASIGTAPEEIDILFLSHLHFDHCSEATLFKNARIIVQKREWQSAFNPVPTQRNTYIQSLFAPLEKMDLVLIDGDREVADGVHALLAPGHTRGNQALAVSTQIGNTVLTGDACYMYINLNSKLNELVDLKGKRFDLPDATNLPFRPPSANVSLVDYFDSLWKLVAAASSRNLLFPGHEAALVGKVIG